MSTVTGQASATEVLHDRFSVSDILNTVCHDVRASLAVTTGSANELAAPENGELSQLQRAFVEMIQRGNARMSRLALNVMYLAELWDGTSELKPTAFDVALVTQQVLDELMRAEPHQKIKVEAPLVPGVGNVTLDLERTRQVLLNVLSVALSVARTRLVLRVQDTGSAVIVTVEDDGPDRMTQAPRASTQASPKKVSSTALVYAVADALMRVMGGELRMRAERQGDKAAAFTVELVFTKQ